MTADVTAAGLLGGAALSAGLCVAARGGLERKLTCGVAWTALVVRVGTYLLASPIIHAFHDNVIGALLSPLLRILPWALAGLGLAVASTEVRAGFSIILGLAVLLGAVGAVTIDWHVLTQSAPAFSAATPPYPGLPAAHACNLYRNGGWLTREVDSRLDSCLARTRSPNESVWSAIAGHATVSTVS